MRALALLEAGGLEHVALAELPRPSPPGPGEVMVRIRTAALNRLDLFVANGLPGATLKFPHVLGSDGAGEVEAVGTGVSDFRPGDRVMLNPGISCGQCPACFEGEESLCANFRVLGEHRSGTRDRIRRRAGGESRAHSGWNAVGPGRGILAGGR